jgi:AcrR family transcriptional regulator
MTERQPPAAAPMKKSDRTRAAILEAARLLFAERGYDAATVRDVAGAAGVDPALVIRYFGNKEALFAQAADFRLDLPDLRTVEPDRVGEALVRHFLLLWEGPRSSGGLAILLRSATSNEMSAQKMREIFAAQVLPALSRLGSRKGAARRAGLVASQVIGLAMTRYVLKLPAVAAIPAEELVRIVAPTIQRYLTQVDA